MIALFGCSVNVDQRGWKTQPSIFYFFRGTTFFICLKVVILSGQIYSCINRSAALF